MADRRDLRLQCPKCATRFDIVSTIGEGSIIRLCPVCGFEPELHPGEFVEIPPGHGDDRGGG